MSGERTILDEILAAKAMVDLIHLLEDHGGFTRWRSIRNGPQWTVSCHVDERERTIAMLGEGYLDGSHAVRASRANPPGKVYLWPAETPPILIDPPACPVSSRWTRESLACLNDARRALAVTEPRAIVRITAV